ncbi:MULTISPECIES: putative bifunctional diguanylate cyclase/phosphodiesterase [Pseudomonas syringae group]|uniref:putative bifunctional diguanylate cyclase/phosphodiesterase n=1 Tax=Pseudomonas syringae group TaxID=136849 RepID=UPI0006E571ED|nr:MULTISPECIES: EAL domain-containing protein [Pseudomonas syringae group]KPY11703.1 GGDEF domain/EAL domain protein [Pseudomonas syringae pv. philadelphi]RMM37577.1 GGDEF domain/EAL domain protein [Pseudomonas syringae pv. berberidis]RMV73548.1 GGDEF domain/EAL domain-containing protein [Pseudomonas coronafaciens pv. atropurpurea]
MLKKMMGALRTLMSVPSDNPRLLQAQYIALSRQLPLMYFVLLVNTWALAFTHWATAPMWLTLLVPTVLTIGCCIRARKWLLTVNKPPPASSTILETLRGTNRLVGIISTAFAAWSLSMYPYGDAYTQAQVAFFMGITVIVCIFCMMHLQSAALITAVIVNTAFVIFFASTHNITFIATAANIVLVSIGMLIILRHQYRDFTSLVNAQFKTEQLSNANLMLANRDSLTGLPNRRHFFQTLDTAMNEALLQRSGLAVGVLDLDGFKPVNDLYGHSVGDRLLMLVAERLTTAASDTVHVSRLGGDEFALVIKGDISNEALLMFGKHLCTLMHESFELSEIPIQIGATLGFATYPATADNATQLFEYADYALYQGKNHNPGSTCIFSASHREQLSADGVTEQALRRANLKTEFHVLFQPIIESCTRETVAFEALARWDSPVLGAVSPAHFIPIAERIGMINELTAPLLTQALQRALSWPSPIRLSFNLSAHDCATWESVKRIVDIIENSGFDASRLDLEITETAVMQDIDQVQQAILRFRQLGCGISLDDFGTGYTSLSQLHALPLTKLKIDRSFVRCVHDNPASYKIVKSLVALSLDMSLGCVIEGVETQDELNALTSLGCTMVQGYFYSPPITFAETLVWIEAPDDERTFG